MKQLIDIRKDRILQAIRAIQSNMLNEIENMTIIETLIVAVILKKHFNNSFEKIKRESIKDGDEWYNEILEFIEQKIKE